MKKIIVIFFSFLILFFTSCSGNTSTTELTGDKPPEVFIKIGNTTYGAILGTYCWGNAGNSVCVDTAGPLELLKDRDPIPVEAGETITFIMDYQPKPSRVSLEQMIGEEGKGISLKNNQFTAPMEKGTYYYSYGTWWLDEEDGNISHGDAFYAFALQVG